MKLKVCGLKDRENIKQVLECGPDYIGFIFYDKSPRYAANELDAEFVRNIASAKKVGVFVNESEIKILDHVSMFALDLVQLHGDESADFCAGIQKNVPVIKVFRINDDFDFSILNAYNKSCEHFLFDADTKQYGGSGKTFNWNKLSAYKLQKSFFLSGGLSLENIDQVKNLNAYCLDVNSRFESSPGIKDVTKLKKMKDVFASKAKQSHNK